MSSRGEANAEGSPQSPPPPALAAVCISQLGDGRAAEQTRWPRFSAAEGAGGGGGCGDGRGDEPGDPPDPGPDSKGTPGPAEPGPAQPHRGKRGHTGETRRGHTEDTGGHVRAVPGVGGHQGAASESKGEGKEGSPLGLPRLRGRGCRVPPVSSARAQPSCPQPGVTLRGCPHRCPSLPPHRCSPRNHGSFPPSPPSSP